MRTEFDACTSFSASETYSDSAELNVSNTSSADFRGCSIRGSLMSYSCRCMYISGVPGTGKTATVHEVISVLEQEQDEGNLPQFTYIEINGMKLTEPNQTYTTFLKALTGQKVSPDQAADILEKRFSNRDANRQPVILLVDELDLLWTRKQNVMYNLFEWPTRKQGKLIVLAIANTMDLPERVMLNRISSRLGLTRMTFQPYTFRQLQEIVYSRIKGIEAFEEDAMELIARKVAALSGDARRCLDICRRAVEIAESFVFGGSPRKRMKGIVGMRHVEEALKEMFSSPKIIAMRNLAKFQAYFMKSVVSEFRRSGLEEALFRNVYDQFQDLCRIEGVQPLNMCETFSVCSTLGSCKLLLLESGRNDINQRIRLNISQDDVLFALKNAKL
eukprot:gene8151-9024_t